MPVSALRFAAISLGARVVSPHSIRRIQLALERIGITSLPWPATRRRLVVRRWRSMVRRIRAGLVAIARSLARVAGIALWLGFIALLAWLGGR